MLVVGLYLVFGEQC